MTQLFYDGFDNPALPNWTQVVPNWTVANSALQGAEDPAVMAGALIVTGNPAWTDYEVSTDTTILESYSDVQTIGESAIVVRYVDADNFYWAGIGLWNHKVSVGIKVAGVYTELAYSGSQSDIIQNRKYNLKVAVKGQEITLFLDGIRVLSFTDGTHMSGLAGFRCWGSRVLYDYIDVSIPTVTPDNTMFYILLIGGATLAFAVSANVLGLFGRRKHKK